MHRKKGGLGIDIEHLIPVGGSHLAEPRSREDAGIATHDVDAAVAFHCGPRHSCTVFFTRNIGGHGAGDSAREMNLGGGSFGLRQISGGQ